ncbi:ribonucleoside-diphosphate reductase, adenosylcobalamin-dependent [Candidatus Giovannonibacteria bacterium RIFCSPLOWO2_01_FULL_43_160]|uniref:Vitamin B12-dependent ribonucleotide reductase n=2 Tax=Candidatus Giovannoniibacteriota TaxID=1752738 RepID=A0A0G1IUY5_9BACT|nr:MAG: Ribonucleotide reductase of class II (Coenzyme B12-dependent) [Candidatus Giovannonibacteria bacterium GW2011_GWB1_43_13]KKS99398.1 MAG: Ribonucleotide reductase of class II (Coenzyme B12-dependent) [Candidatus Giovannonibacteria bacterium GW2011_GWA1_43_15]KKT21776.1 MAG: Ribonucleotide reductase of class II (Coenzyme B12-dependent) [Candidatus Giovannonibacteria bacterium GW2011_GWC2_43_8]KKT62935.1 MAG: Ribonucleotide reductase of class II (Coenzyme B12-dependent) [Candidatus Giovanno
MNDAGNVVLKDNPQTGVFFMKKGLAIKRYFTKEGVHPYDELEWERRTAKITSSKGEIIFEQPDVEVPKFWSQTATDIVAEKYFMGHVGKPGREYSVRQLIDRVADTVTGWGKKDGYFAADKDSQIFNEELKWLLVNQRASFNSPVWFNVGVEKKPQCSACFILSITDDKESIAEWYRTEMMIFSGGSGAGINLSNLRSSKENISNRGKSSGPVSFMKGADAIAGTIRSGGKTRRAAKMVILNANHPDIRHFIVSKWKEEEKAKALIALGYDDSIDGDIYTNIFFQNANNSVRATDDFMNAILADKNWDLKMVKTGEVFETIRARDLMNTIAEAAWNCADPGMQFDTTINKWHTAPATGRINGSNPCSEYMHLDDSACNLASINLLTFLKEGEFDFTAFKKAVDILIIAQDSVIDNSSYPTPKIEQNARDFRELGLGYTNLGAMLMQLGFAYDSDEARAWAGAISSIMTGEAYKISAEIAEAVGAFAGYKKNREPMLNVIKMHGDEAKKINKKHLQRDLWEAAQTPWAETYENGKKFGVRNSQVSVIAPTGTISFMMDATTTGIEPAFSLVAYKKMVGGGFLKIVNTSVERALKNLGYKEKEASEIMDYILAHDGIEGAPHLKEKDFAIFDCATNAPGGKRAIHYSGHIRMMAAVQPFISGAISKTVNLPESATVEDITNTYIDAWRMGLKAIAIYRDKSKGSQPLNTSKTKTAPEEIKEAPSAVERKKLPHDVKSLRHKFSIAGHEGYIHCGVYEDGKLGEVFIRVAKEGSTISGLLDAIGVLMSVALQSGVPVETIIRKFVHSRFEPAGFTENPDIPLAKSILDYIGKFLALNFLSPDDQASFGIYSHQTQETTAAAAAEPVKLSEQPKLASAHASTIFAYQDAPACRCGAIMIRTGSCYTCPSCGENLGSCS